ncbi:UV DNA damage repair endonuclease UvsE [Paenibacillus sp.]|uniref:UV DNA damage repair endonuclease UvsE n=1 Tax=Paenibacillus sp. TaxID=58172 RepID=UPI002811E36C|nr:UV DNA damage repair endonuclease UvsE [Paenibacillus sp.]
MEIRLGYVSTALALFHNTPSSTFTYKRFGALPREEATERLLQVARNNLEATRRILYYNAAHGVRLFRLSSALVPLATHPDVELDVRERFGVTLAELGAFARKERMRLSMHPNQFTLLNGSDAVVAAAIRDLEYHAAILEGMGLDEEHIVNIHIGGVYGDKPSAIERLHEQLPRVPERIRARLTFENDDKTYTLEETLAVCERAGQPMMLDLHHDACNPSPSPPLEYLSRVAASWGGRPMKIHVSSPKSEKEFRSHADDVEAGPVAAFLKGCREAGLPRIDVMVEAKRKDLACFRLAEELAGIRGIKRIEGAVLQW